MVATMILSILLLFALNANSWSTDKFCGKIRVEDMKHALYKSRDGSQKNLRIAPSRSGHGGFGSVFIGFSDQLSKCVAVKSYDQADQWALQNSVHVLDKVHSNGNTTHIMQIYDSGYLFGKSAPIMLMEMGSANFEQRLRENDQQNGHAFTDADMNRIVWELVQPLQELHQVAMHLDLWPDNYMYMRDENGHEQLKLIDFDGAQLIPDEPSTASQEGSADYRTANIHHIYNHMFRAPETLGGEVSTKADIWSLGVMLLQFVKQKLPSLQDKGMQMHFSMLVDLYKQRNPAVGASKRQNFFSPHLNAVGQVLRIWAEMPRTAMLITNLLQTNSKRRMSANGILAYLRGLCAPFEFNANFIFQDVTFEQLQSQIAERIVHWEQRGGKGVTFFVRDQLQKMVELNETFEHAAKQHADLVQALAHQKATCDTKTTQIWQDGINVGEEH